MHVPVLLEEVLKYLAPKPGEFIIDGTVDGGGHAAAILERIMPDGSFLGVDLDREMVQKTGVKIAAHPKRQIPNSKQISVVHGNYADLPEILREKNFSKADGLFLDLGFSSEQLEGKGFSFLRDEPLTMTYDNAATPVSKLLRGLSEQELAKVLREYGEERCALRIAKTIKERLRKGNIETTGVLARVVADAVPRGYRGRIHPATRTFQALRIYANDELGNLTRVLEELPEILKEGGRAVIISFHSLEDRIVKNAFREMVKQGILEILTKKPVEAAKEEMRKNPRSRSAKLRAAVMHAI